MNDSAKALEHLKVIRDLMEKATVYRAVSVPTAVAGGLLAILTAGTLFALNSKIDRSMTMSIWLGIFVLVKTFHHGLIWRTASSEGEPYLSSGLRMALKAMLPPMFVGGVLGLALGYGPSQDIVAATLIWSTCYGLALMATSGFSPRSLRMLGLAFTLVGSLLLGLHWGTNSVSDLSPQRTAAIIMGMTFGIFHLAYAIWARLVQREPEPAA